MENFFQEIQEGICKETARLLIEKKFGGKIPETITPVECYELMREYNHYLEEMVKNWAHMCHELVNTKTTPIMVKLDPPPSQ